MLEALLSLLTLRWTSQPPQYHPLPAHIERAFVKTPRGDLELLISQPKDKGDAPPVFFAHGGYGSASVWIDFIHHLHHAGYRGPLYAYSFRNHGASYSVSYLNMVYRTPLASCVEDLRSCLEYARQHAESGEFAVVGHSSGGGLLQHALARGLIKARALCLLDAIPHFGSYGVYWNWWKTDPWFPLRNLLHFQHPTSPLSSDRLVHQAFFGRQYPMSKVYEFRRWMPSYESMGWPIGMFGEFWAWWQGRPKWLDPKNVLRSLARPEKRDHRAQICIIVGSEDMMIDTDMCRLQTAEYRDALRHETPERNEDSLPTHRKVDPRVGDVEGVETECSGGVALAIIAGAGHHSQNDVQSASAARVFQHFLEQV